MVGGVGEGLFRNLAGWVTQPGWLGQTRPPSYRARTFSSANPHKTRSYNAIYMKFNTSNVLKASKVLQYCRKFFER